MPSYIPARNFALALIGVVSKASDGAPPLARLRDGISELPNSETKTALQAFVSTAQDDIDRVRSNIESWFNSSMDRVAGWYKRWSQAVIFGIGLALVVAINADTLALAQSLVRDPSLHQTMVAAAQEQARRDPQKQGDDLAQQLQQDFVRLGMPLGWDPGDRRTWPGSDAMGWFLKVIGLVLTTLAISMGAPFWFDVLNRFMLARSTIKPTVNA